MYPTYKAPADKYTHKPLKNYRQFMQSSNKLQLMLCSCRLVVAENLVASFQHDDLEKQPALVCTQMLSKGKAGEKKLHEKRHRESSQLLLKTIVTKKVPRDVTTSLHSKTDKTSRN